MFLLSAAQAKLIDKKAEQEYKIPLAWLMENAGSGVANLVKKLQRNKNIKNIVIMAGVGNNGADALVAMRHLPSEELNIILFYTDKIEKASYLFKQQNEILVAMGIEILSAEDNLSLLIEKLKTADLIIDAILGTGIDGQLRDNIMAYTNLINASNASVLAIDIPTGITADRGTVFEGAVKADYTITMEAPKLAMYLYPAKDYCGEVTIQAIGGPNLANIIIDERNILIDNILIKKIMPNRMPMIHKGDNGHVLVVGGAKGMIGAPLLTSIASIYSGAGKTTLGLEESIYDETMQRSAYEVMGQVLPSEDNNISWDEVCYDKDVVAIGPGLGRKQLTATLIQDIAQNYGGPIVADADVLYTDQIDSLFNREIPTIMTPHLGEFAKMTGLRTTYIERNRVQVAREYAKDNNIILVLKGAPTVIALGDGTVYINPTGNPGMATGGMGDVLTGVIAAFVAQGLPVEEAAIVGVYLHGLSADILMESTKIGYTASDVAKGIGMAINKVISEEN